MFTPTLFKQCGFDAIVINRMHHRTKDKLKALAQLEFAWEAPGGGGGAASGGNGNVGGGGGGGGGGGARGCQETNKLLLLAPRRGGHHNPGQDGKGAILAHVLHSHYVSPKGFDLERYSKDALFGRGRAGGARGVDVTGDGEKADTHS
jgi:hypothetical protein